MPLSRSDRRCTASSLKGVVRPRSSARELSAQDEPSRCAIRLDFPHLQFRASAAIVGAATLHLCVAGSAASQRGEPWKTISHVLRARRRAAPSFRPSRRLFISASARARCRRCAGRAAARPFAATAATCVTISTISTPGRAPPAIAPAADRPWEPATRSGNAQAAFTAAPACWPFPAPRPRPW